MEFFNQLFKKNNDKLYFMTDWNTNRIKLNFNIPVDLNNCQKSINHHSQKTEPILCVIQFSKVGYGWVQNLSLLDAET